MQFRIVTYNIHKGIGGVDRRYRPERIIETLSHYDPDILLLQEVDDGAPRSRHHRQVDLLGDALSLSHRAFQPNVTLRQGQYGNAILSRFPLSDVEDIDLTVRFKKRRRALVARCLLHWEHHTRSVLVVNVHLGLAGFERSQQLRRLVAHDRLARVQRQTAVIAAGDFNDAWGKLGKRILEPVGFAPASYRINTFPAIRPLRPLDRIYSRGNLKLLRCFASRARVARLASDHLPLTGEFQIVE
jgi:endonuclease/exonuclease/phosphatase family metal-dependent hydrolase